MDEFGNALERLEALHERLYTAGRNELPEIRRKLDQTWKEIDRETAELTRFAEQVVLHVASFESELLYELGEIERLGEGLPDHARNEFRRRCGRVRSLVQEWR